MLLWMMIFNLACCNQALRACQAGLSVAQQDVERLRTENNALKAALGASTAEDSESGPSWIPNPALFPHAREMTLLAKKATITEFLWLLPQAFGQPCPIPNPEECPGAKYATPEAFATHVTYRLYSIFPQKFHDHIENMPAFQSAVRIIYHSTILTC